jgi:hypothetical protein
VKVIVPAGARPSAASAAPVRPATAQPAKPEAARADGASSANRAPRSIFDTPDADGVFGSDQISDKSLDEVILSYLTEEEPGDG